MARNVPERSRIRQLRCKCSGILLAITTATALVSFRATAFSTTCRPPVAPISKRGTRLQATNGDSQSSSTSSDNNKDSKIALQDDYSTLNQKRAGTDGYSLLRQPLLKESWDPNLDPSFEAPDTMEETPYTKMDFDWWSDKQQASKQQDRRTAAAASRKSRTRDNWSEEEQQDELDLFQRSLETLDFPFILKALRNECETLPAKRLAESGLQDAISGRTTSSAAKMVLAYQPLTAESPDGCLARFGAVQELQWLLSLEEDPVYQQRPSRSYKNRQGYEVTLSAPPLSGLNFDLESIFAGPEQAILEGPELLDICLMMNAMEELQLWNHGLLQQQQPEWLFQYLPAIVEEIQLNTTLQDLLEDAFDVTGKLSGDTFPVLGRLRAKIRSLKSDILETLDNLVSLPSIQSKLALESGGPLYSEISNGGGRLVLPMDPKYATQIGIVHDSSRSGKTVYVEPSEVVGPTNELRQTEGELKAEEARVWRSLTEQVYANQKELETSISAVGQLDLSMARYRLGLKLKGVIPRVQDEGVISLQDAKHPVLMLRHIENVVGSDIELGGDGNQALVLTGPNSGGKTVIMKLLGLVALMARSGIPIPASPTRGEYEPRVDFFNPVLADIGDIQSVGGDLSTFSGHMLVCREVLANSNRNALVLMDELGSGTDPAQGVAIAQALLEALLETGCRVAITTHYMALKQLATSDDRFSVAGMQFVQGRPTYKLLPGTIGESFALAVAERLQLPPTVIARANDLLDSETRQMGDLIRELEDQKNLIDEQVAELEARKDEMASLERQMKEEQRRLEKKMLTARRDEAKKFAQKLKEKEQVLEEILEKLKRDPSRRILAKSWEDIKFVRRDALNEAENVPSVLRAKKKAAQAAEELRAEWIPLAELREKPDLQEGDKLIVCKAGNLLGREAIVVKNMGKQFQVNVGGLPMTLRLTDVALPVAGKAAVQGKASATLNTKQRLSKAAEKAVQSEGAPKPGKPNTVDDEPSQRKHVISIRTESNTVDVRGCYFEEATSVIKEKISKCIMNGNPVVYVLHGHGTGGVLKKKVRQWLKSERGLVKEWGPAEATDGGDAFTKLVL